ncbi:MAG: tetratricopeptide repeat protein [Anaerolineae bacterium]|nr:tetratricopeptide repeat protein [Anaerolineae bacterium]MDW8171704.1 tetratricopeptide repeat protein [Anaerolineae bacterium]
MRRLPALLMLMCVFGSPILAQDASPTADPLAEVRTLGATAQARLEAVQEAADKVERGVDRAFNLLGLFEAIGIFITVGAGVAALFGVSQLYSARNDTKKINEDLKKQADDLLRRFNEEIEQRKRDVENLREELMRAEQEQHKNTVNALIGSALLPIGERQYRNGDQEGAIATYQRALELDPNNPVFYQRLGYIFTQQNKFAQAEQYYERAIGLERDFAPAIAGLGFVYRRMGDGEQDKMRQSQLYNQAESHLLRALNLSERLLDEDGEPWWGVLGGLYRRRGQIDQAIYAYHKVTQIAPNSSYGFGNLALLYMKKNDREAMLKTYRHVERIAETEIRSKAGNFWGYADLIVARFALGKSEQALDNLPIAIGVAPTNAPYMLEGLRDTLVDLAQVVEDEKRLPIEQAIQELNRELAQRAAQTQLEQPEGEAS